MHARERTPDSVEREIDDAKPGLAEVVGQEAVFEQIRARLVAEAFDVECRSILERPRGADRMEARDVAAELRQRIAAIELGRTPAMAGEDREAEALERMQRPLTETHRRNGRHIGARELGDQRVLLEDLRVAPARGPIEFRNRRRRIITPCLVDAVLVAVERKQAPVTANADAVECIEHAIGREAGVRRRVCYCWHRLLIFASVLHMIATDRIYRQWDDEIVPRLVDYVRIPAKSPHFDAAWEAHGHIERVVALAEAWARAQRVKGLAVEIVRLPGRTPLLYFEAPGQGERTVLLYGHLDKQPEMIGWRADGGAWTPVIENGKLYGRGAADDGYAIFAALSSLGALDAQGIPHARCVGLIETCEESGSYDLPV